MPDAWVALINRYSPMVKMLAFYRVGAYLTNGRSGSCEIRWQWHTRHKASLVLGLAHRSAARRFSAR